MDNGYDKSSFIVQALNHKKTQHFNTGLLKVVCLLMKVADVYGELLMPKLGMGELEDGPHPPTRFNSSLMLGIRIHKWP